MITEQNLSVIYSGDEGTVRQKKHGPTLIQQTITSVESIRKNWSNSVPIYFTHTQSLPSATINQFKSLKVTPHFCRNYIFPEYPPGNKLNFENVDVSTDYVLFLDCDTIVHKPVMIDETADIYVSYDALLGLSQEEFRLLFEFCDVPFPEGKFFQSPAYQYYYHDRNDLFPVLNSGVFVIRSNLREQLAKTCGEHLRKTLREFGKAKFVFYLEQACFVVSIYQLGLKFKMLPKGYNFICTPRAGSLKDWPRDQIFIEHYAGDNSKPMAISS